MNYLLVFFGGGLGASLRHAVNMAAAKAFGTAFPYGTFIINITGSIVMGLIAGYLAFRGDAKHRTRNLEFWVRRVATPPNEAKSTPRLRCSQTPCRPFCVSRSCGYGVLAAKRSPAGDSWTGRAG